MTPESIRLIGQLRSEFYTLFAAAMSVPVKISGSSYNSSSYIASWIDDRDKLNYVNIYACAAPDRLITDRPFILRIAVNQGAGQIGATQSRSCSKLNQTWRFELTVLPEEILDFLPWIVSLVKAKAQGESSFTQEPPHVLSANAPNLLFAEKVWTQQAERMANLQHSPVLQTAP